MPGIPGVEGGTDNIAMEILTFLDLPAGRVVMGVNSDDGFRTSTGPNAGDITSLQLGTFNGGRGAADTIFDFVVEKAGIFPFRTIWYEGGGGANIEWFTVKADGSKVLINDTAAGAGGIKSYREATTPPYLKSVSPAPDTVDVELNSPITLTLADGSTKVQASTIKLNVDGKDVTPTVTGPVNGITTVKYTPAPSFTGGKKIPVKLTFSDNATPAVTFTREVSFTTKPEFTLLIGIDDKQMWSYENTGKNLGTSWKEKSFNDSSWPKGPALLAFETGATAAPIRTELVRQSPEGNQIVTDYFRTHFTFNGDPKATSLRIRHVVDDSLALYLNGTEIYRFYLPATGSIDSTTLAVPSDHENRYEGPFEIPASALVAGDNVLAAEVHQSSATSSDIVFGLELQAIVSAVKPEPPKINGITRAGTNITIDWSGTATLQSADAVTGPWTDVSNAKSPLSVAVSGNAKFYRLKQ